ncbi:MAG: cell division protein FtsZ [Theionarchaea archaeon]|nr:cell division protein FtsZ [Theionarchaea archaeon]MBU7020441.1 cell division protein FtsZ [Theionarchaea archaeon]MBU7034780.1 cell division protein FtsZ [Theionarchaea archaeon]MBU7040882.1 cell division protein FtsZ [Theionarchaea archaeon]
MKSILMNAEQHIRKDKPFETKLDIEETLGKARILVVGCGGAGNNTINRLEKIGGINGAETIAVNTDRQHLEVTQADKHILIGRGITKGLGAGGDPSLGYQSAEEDRRDLKEILRGANMVFVAAGMGGGTGTGAAPVVADIAHELDALVIGVVTLPFQMEGKHRHEKAQLGLKALQRAADTVITLDNNKLMELCPHAPLDYAFSVSDEVLAEMVKGISETILEPSLVNLDYADVRSVMIDGGVAMVGVGESNTNNRAQEAVEEALRNRLLEVDYTNAKGALVHVSGGPSMKLSEASAVGEYINRLVGDENSRIIWGARIDESLKDSMRVMLIVTGVNSPYISGRRPADGGSYSISDMFSPRPDLGGSHNIYEYLGIDEVEYGR